jgi:hypothetical protein
MTGKRGQYALCVALILGGLFCLAITVTVNLMQGYTLGTTEVSRRLYGAAALAVDVVGVAMFAALTGLLYRHGALWKARALSLVVLGFMGFSMIMFYGFGATHRIAPTLEASARHAAQVAATRAAAAKADALRESQLAFLRSEASKASTMALNTRLSKDKREEARAARQAAYDQLASGTFGEIEVSAEPVAPIVDPQALALSEDTGLSLETVQKLLTVSLGILLIVAKALSFGYGFRLWPEASATGDKSKDDAGTTAAETVETVSGPPLPVAANDDKPTRSEATARDDVDQLALLLTGEVERHVAAIDQVAEFVASATRPARAARVLASDVHNHYRAWAAARGYLPELSANKFGRCMSELNETGQIAMPKVTDGKFNYYLARALYFSDAMAEAA